MAESKIPLTGSPSIAHTPIPWKNAGFKITDEAGRTIVDLRSVPMLPFASDTEIANAKFIVRAVNSHQDLLDACRNAVEHCPMCRAGMECQDDTCYQMRAAILKAEEVKP